MRTVKISLHLKDGPFVVGAQSLVPYLCIDILRDFHADAGTLPVSGMLFILPGTQEGIADRFTPDFNIASLWVSGAGQALVEQNRSC